MFILGTLIKNQNIGIFDEKCLKKSHLVEDMMSLGWCLGDNAQSNATHCKLSYLKQQNLGRKREFITSSACLPSYLKVGGDVSWG